MLTVYTAIMGGYDRLRPVASGVRHVCFTDRQITVDGWEIRTVPRRFTDPRREARMYKLLPHQWLPEADATIWRDGNIDLVAHPAQLLTFVAEQPIAALRHPDRDCIYDEAGAVRHTGRGGEEAYEQVTAYYHRGFPAHYGAAETGVLVRRRSAAVEALCSLWWAELTRWSVRDQLSFAYTCWRYGMRWAELPGNVRSYPWYAFRGHGE